MSAFLIYCKIWDKSIAILKLGLSKERELYRVSNNQGRRVGATDFRERLK